MNSFLSKEKILSHLGQIGWSMISIILIVGPGYATVANAAQLEDGTQAINEALRAAKQADAIMTAETNKEFLMAFKAAKEQKAALELSKDGVFQVTQVAEGGIRGIPIVKKTFALASSKPAIALAGTITTIATVGTGSPSLGIASGILIRRIFK